MIQPKIEISAISDEMWMDYLSTREGLEKRDLPEPAKQILLRLSTLSFLENKTEARVRWLTKLAEAAHLDKGNLRRYLDVLIKSDIVLERYDPMDECFYFEIKPDWQMWHVPRRFTREEEQKAELALKLLREAPDPKQLELIEREKDVGAEVSRAFAETRPESIEPPANGIESMDPTLSYRPPLPGFREQMDRLERVAPESATTHRFWWQAQAGRDPKRLTAMRQAIDDFTTCRKRPDDPNRWIVTVFKNKVRALAAQEPA